MIKGILVVVALGVAAGWIGFSIGEWWVDTKMPNAELEGIFPPAIGTILGVLAGLGAGIGIAYALGRRDGS